MELITKVFTTLLILSFLTGCASFKETSFNEREPLTVQSISKLEGVYELKSDNVVQANYSGNHGKLYNNFKVLYTTNIEEPLEQYTVQLKILSPKKIKLELYKDSNLLASKIRKGRVEANYFYCKSQLLIVPFFPLIGGYRAQRQRIAISADALIVDLREHYFLFSLIAGQSDNRQARYYYKRVD